MSIRMTEIKTVTSISSKAMEKLNYSYVAGGGCEMAQPLQKQFSNFFQKLNMLPLFELPNAHLAFFPEK